MMYTDPTGEISIREGASLAVSFIPVVGDAKDAQEVLTGVDLISGEKLSTTERAITAVAAVVPIVSGVLIRKAFKAAVKSEKGGTVLAKRGMAATEGGKRTQEVIARKAPGSDGATSQHLVEKLDGQTNSITHQVIQEGEIIHQHQTHVGAHGTRRQFPDEWVEFPQIPPESR